METSVLFLFLLTFMVLPISLYIITSLRHNRKSTGKSPPPPGQKGWPFIGETLEFYRRCQEGRPEAFINDRTRKFASKIFTTSLFAEDTIIFCGAAANKYLFTGANEFSAMGFTRSFRIIVPSLEEARKTPARGRKLSEEFFRPDYLKRELVGVIDHVANEQYFDRYTDRVQQVVTHEQSREAGSAHEVAQDYVFSLACRLFLNLVNPARQAKLERLYKNIALGLSAIPLNFPGTTFYRGVKSARALREDIGLIIKEKKLDATSRKSSEAGLRSTDMLSHFLQSQFNQTGEFPSDLLVADMFLGFLVAGIDSVSGAITCIVKNLTEHSSVYSKVLQEQMEISRSKKAGDLLNWEDLEKMKYTWCVAQETMRLTPAVIGAFRKATVDFTYGGFTIPKGWMIFWSVLTTNKNPEYFKNPEEFDPSRFEGSGPAPYSFVPFGGGPHICPGKEFVKIEILVFIHNLITKFHFEKVIPNEKVFYNIGATLASGCPIRLHPRNEQTN